MTEEEKLELAKQKLELEKQKLELEQQQFEFEKTKTQEGSSSFNNPNHNSSSISRFTSLLTKYKVALTLLAVILLSFSVYYGIYGRKFNVKDQSAWNNKLSEGFWENDVDCKVRNSNQPVKVKFQFNENGTFVLDNTGGLNGHWDGVWKLENYEGNDNAKMIVCSFNRDFYNYTRVAGSLNYSQSNGKFSMGHFSSRGLGFDFKHYSSSDKLIDDTY